jgi:hypothetical protein
VELVEVYPVHSEPAQAPFAGLAQVLGPSVWHQPARFRASEAAFGGDDQPLGIGMKRLGDQALGDLRAVDVSGVY